MTIIASAPVPSHLNLREADTAAFPAVRPLAERVDEMVGVGLSVIQIAEQLGVTAHAAFKAGARIRTADDVTAVAATMPAASDAERTEIATFAAMIVAMPLGEQTVRYGVSLDTAERVRGLFATSGTVTQTCPDWCELQGKHLVDEHPDDRTHFGDTTHVECTLEQLVGQDPHRAWANLVQHDFDQQPRINAFLGHDPIDMTPAEARKYAAALIALADTAEQTGTER